MPADASAMMSPSPAPEHESLLTGQARCPPEESRTIISRDATEEPVESMNHDEMSYPTPSTQRDSPPATRQQDDAHKGSDTEVDGPLRDIPTPISAIEDSEEQRKAQISPISTQLSAPAAWYQPSLHTSPFPGYRQFVPNSSSSFLRPGSKFEGTQESDRQKYDVQVEIKHVDMRESFLCGYLRIKGLTEDHPSLTTYFEGEIIGNKYTFITQHPEWGSNEKVDRQHWARFQAYKPVAKYSSRTDQYSKDWLQKEHIFMRWKEYFLVPDHRVRTINGASFEGFYYICFNQVSGVIEGIYFHAKSEKFQQLKLRHIRDAGCMGAMEFR